MYEKGKREAALRSAIEGWRFAPLIDRGEDGEPVETEVVGERRLPRRFGGWWREHDGDEPTGREIELRLRAVPGRVEMVSVTFTGFDDDFDRQGLPEFRTATEWMVGMLDETAYDGAVSGALRSSTVEERERAIGEVRRRRRSNAVPVDEVARLWPSGGAKTVVDEFGVSEATAYRWRKQAIELGLMGER
ncbi:MAG: hypothetical protein AAGF73_09030 [Actinomycetota bacterium]